MRNIPVSHKNPTFFISVQVHWSVAAVPLCLSYLHINVNGFLTKDESSEQCPISVISRGGGWGEQVSTADTFSFASLL